MRTIKPGIKWVFFIGSPSRKELVRKGRGVPDRISFLVDISQKLAGE
jgi:hypothetical protein